LKKEGVGKGDKISRNSRLYKKRCRMNVYCGGGRKNSDGRPTMFPGEHPSKNE